MGSANVIIHIPYFFFLFMHPYIPDSVTTQYTGTDDLTFLPTSTGGCGQCLVSHMLAQRPTAPVAPHSTSRPAGIPRVVDLCPRALRRFSTWSEWNLMTRVIQMRLLILIFLVLFLGGFAATARGARFRRIGVDGAMCIGGTRGVPVAGLNVLQRQLVRIEHEVLWVAVGGRLRARGRRARPPGTCHHRGSPARTGIQRCLVVRLRAGLRIGAVNLRYTHAGIIVRLGELSGRWYIG